MAVSLPKILELVARAKNKDEKKATLVRYDNGALREILKYAFHPDLKFLLPSGIPPYKSSVVDETDNPTYLYGLVRKLYLFVEGGNPNLVSKISKICSYITGILFYKQYTIFIIEFSQRNSIMN